MKIDDDTISRARMMYIQQGTIVPTIEAHTAYNDKYILVLPDIGDPKISDRDKNNFFSNIKLAFLALNVTNYVVFMEAWYLDTRNASDKEMTEEELHQWIKDMGPIHEQEAKKEAVFVAKVVNGNHVAAMTDICRDSSGRFTGLGKTEQMEGSLSGGALVELLPTNDEREKFNDLDTDLKNRIKTGILKSMGAIKLDD